MALTKISNEVIEQNLENYLKKGLKAGSALGDLEISTYADAAGINPIDGLGGSAGITVSLNTESPLSGDADLRLAKDSSNRQGNGISIPFTIENRHLAKVLQISFDAELISGTYSTGDLRVSVIQDPSGTPVLLEPVGTSLELGIANQRMREIATFQTHVSITSYRLCIHVSSTSTSAYTVDFANFRVWETTQSIGAVITDWQSYTPTIVGWNSVTSINLQWRRVGNQMEIQGNFTGTTNNSSTVAIPLPFGSAVTTTGSVRLSTGFAKRDTAGSGFSKIYPLSMTSGGTAINGSEIIESSGTVSPMTARIGTNWGDGTWYIEASVPIAGWGSSVAMSSDTGDGRVVAATITGSLSTGASPTVNLTWSSPTILNDTHSAFNGTTGYTAPVSGFYQFNGYFNTDSATGQAWNAWVSGSNRQSCGFSLSGFVAVSGVVFLLAGQNLTFRPNATGGNVGSVGSGNYFTVSRISAGTQQIAASETVVVSCTRSGGSSTPAAALTWTSKEIDTHGTMNIGTGVFTVPVSGKYFLTAEMLKSGAINSGNEFGIALEKGTTRIAYGSLYISGSNVEHIVNASIIVNCIAGDTFRATGYGNQTDNVAWARLGIVRLGV
jgi:hypothetical protein